MNVISCFRTILTCLKINVTPIQIISYTLRLYSEINASNFNHFITQMFCFTSRRVVFQTNTTHRLQASHSVLLRASTFSLADSFPAETVCCWNLSSKRFHISQRLFTSQRRTRATKCAVCINSKQRLVEEYKINVRGQKVGRILQTRSEY